MRDIIRAKSCTDAWLQAACHLYGQDDLRDYNLVLEISDPMSLVAHERQVFGELNQFLVSHGKHPVSTVINTIFPASLYRKHGAQQLFDRYIEVTPSLSEHEDTKWGTYFMRMTRKTDQKGLEIRPLQYLMEKLRREVSGCAPKRAVYELNLVEPFLDIPIYDAGSDKHYRRGGPCLSHLSFKLKADRSLLLTAFYRYHYYVERALGNFCGLAMLQDFVATECDIKAAELVCISSMAILDTEGTGKAPVVKMLDACMRFSDRSLVNSEVLSR